jgi:hypothetical protein
MHRGCRLSAAFPDAYTAENGLLTFDVSKIEAQLDRTRRSAELE